MRQRIGARLIGGFLIGAAITILVGAIAMFALVRVNNSANAVLNIDVKELDLMDRLATDLAGARRYEKEFFLFSEIGNPAKQEEYSAKLDKAWEALAQDVEEHRHLPPGASIRDETDELVQLIAQGYQELTVLKNLMLAGGSYEEVQPQYQEYRSTVHKLEDLTGNMSLHVRAILQERQKGLIETQASLRNLVVGTVVAAVILAVLMGIALTRTVTGPVGRLSQITRKIAAGDLTQRAEVTSEDELGKLATSFNQMTERLQESRYEIQEKNQELEATNEELRASNEELRATEEELRAANEELQSANDELREAQEQLIRSEKLAAIGQLASGVGHELRNPLGAIKNAAFYVRRKVARTDLPTTEPRVPEFLDIIDGEVNAANKVITDLLGFSRVAKPTVSPANLADIIDDTLKLTPLPENIELARDIDENLPRVMVDADQIRQVFGNIILNAQQAMADGGRLDIRARSNGEFMEVAFADTGSGIPETEINKIFDPLFTTKAKGIGLGLSVSKSILERHGGDIRVDSEVGKGTTFTMSLPTQ